MIMGYNPKSIRFLKLAENNGFSDAKKMKIIGENIKSLKKEFPHVNNFRYKNTMKLLFKFLDIYAKIVDDIIPPVLEGL